MPVFQEMSACEGERLFGDGGGGNPDYEEYFWLLIPDADYDSYYPERVGYTTD